MQLRSWDLFFSQQALQFASVVCRRRVAKEMAVSAMRNSLKPSIVCKNVLKNVCLTMTVLDLSMGILNLVLKPVVYESIAMRKVIKLWIIIPLTEAAKVWNNGIVSCPCCLNIYPVALALQGQLFWCRIGYFKINYICICLAFYGLHETQLLWVFSAFMKTKFFFTCIKWNYINMLTKVALT